MSVRPILEGRGQELGRFVGSAANQKIGSTPDHFQSNTRQIAFTIIIRKGKGSREGAFSARKKWGLEIIRMKKKERNYL